MCDTNDSEEHGIVDEWLETLGELEEAEEAGEAERDEDDLSTAAFATEVRQPCR